MANKGKKGSVRALSKLDLSKPLKIAAAAKARIKADLSKNGAGVFKVPGLMRITVKRKPATKARMGINPFTKEQVMFKAKPARNVVRVRPLKPLSQMV